MAVWLTMDMSYVGTGGSANTSRVAVSVDVHWDYKHFNRDGGSLTVTVDGVTDTRTVPFNAGETSSGSQNIYSAQWDVAQPNGEAKTVYASATFQATSNTTATPASDSLYLSAISGSGGDSGGDSGDDGDDTGGEGGGDTGANKGNCVAIDWLYCNSINKEWNHESICAGYSNFGQCNMLYRLEFVTPSFTGVSEQMQFVWENTQTSTGSAYLRYALLSSDANVDKYIDTTGEVVDEHQIVSGVWGTVSATVDTKSLSIPTDSLESNTKYHLIIWPGAKQQETYFSYGSNLTVNLVYNESVLTHPDTNCIYLGTSTVGSGSYGNVGMEDYTVTGYGFLIKFKTPSDLAEATSVTVRLNNYMVESSSTDNPDSIELDCYLFDHEPDNANAYMTSVRCVPNELGVLYDTYDVVIPTTELEPGTEYFVRIKAVNNSANTGLSVSVDAPVGIIIGYVASQKPCYISSESSNDPYTVHIEDGTTWYEYEVYVDNGTSWDTIG